ncbi:MAG: Nif3-like dinuclear metal center hexameric protein [Cryomorphaceae bacterium]|nr:MAG: Nif3-like dinuclear metal center hexameric protein [Cryomorphaceae bacterium]
MTIGDLIKELEKWAPPALQESYDNAGLITGDASEKVSGVLISLDCTEDVVEEALRRGCNMIVSHHPIVFRGLKSLTGANYVERTVLKAIRGGVALYAIHTNLDNVDHGVNHRIADQLGLVKREVLRPMPAHLRQLVVYVPRKDADKVRDALFAGGAGHIGNYDECSFNIGGTGTFRPLEGSNPTDGQHMERSYADEVQISVIYPAERERSILQAMVQSHPYEVVAHEIYALQNADQTRGAGMVGNLPEGMDEMAFLSLLKERFGCGCVRHTALLNRQVKRVALCGGSGSFLLRDAIAAKADVFVTSDFKYHEFFDSERKIVIADIGHYESEQFTIDLIGSFLREKFSTFAVHFTQEVTNPINYF